MSVPFSGLNVTVDYTATSVSDLVTNTKDALVLAGWSAVASGGGFDCTTAITPQGLQVTVDLRSGASYMTAKFHNTTSMTTTWDAVQLAINPQDMRIVANPYQFFTYEPGISSAANHRSEFMGGVPYIPPFLEAGTTEAWWVITANDRNTFRETVDPIGLMAAAFNGSLMEAAANDSVYNGRTSIIPPRSTAGGNPSEIFWYDGSALDAECLIAWGSVRDSDKKAIGVVWDMVCIWDSFPFDDEQSFGGKNWVSISSSTMTPTLWVVKD